MGLQHFMGRAAAMADMIGQNAVARSTRWNWSAIVGEKHDEYGNWPCSRNDRDRSHIRLSNGFQDASNIVATVTASRALTRIQAVILVAGFEFPGPLLGGTAVANTIGGFIDVSRLDQVTSLSIILAGVIGAIAWNLVTWWLGVPSSSSHALVGGLIGPVLGSAGPYNEVWGFENLVLYSIVWL